MSTRWVVHLRDGRQLQVTTRDNSIWFLRSAAPPPDKLRPALILNANQWTMAVPEGATIVVTAQPSPATPETSERVIPAFPG